MALNYLDIGISFLHTEVKKKSYSCYAGYRFTLGPDSKFRNVTTQSKILALSAKVGILTWHRAFRNCPDSYFAHNIYIKLFHILTYQYYLVIEIK